ALTTTATGVFADKNAGTGKTVNLTATTSAGANTSLANYTVTEQATTTADIAKKAVTVSGITAAGKAYDGTTSATVSTANVVYAGLVEGEALTTTATGVFADKNAGTGKTVNLTATTSAGANTSLANYTVAEQTTTTADITPKAVTISGITAANKVYDGNTAAVVDGSGMIATGLVGDERITLGEFMGTFADKNVGTGKTVTFIGGYSAGPDTDLNNYAITGQASTTANITPKALTISGSSVANKTYDGSTTASVTVGTLSGLVEGETLGATSATGAFADKNAGANKDVSVTYTLTDGAASITAGAPIFDGSGNIIGSAPLVLPGAKASNYSLAAQTLKADIAQKALTVSGFAASGKTYDGTTAATITNAGSLVGVVQADATKVTLDNTGATFADKNVGTAKTVTLNGTGLSGAEAANYSLAEAAVTTTADITPATLTYVATPVSVILGQPYTLSGEVTGWKGDDTQASDTSGTAQWLAQGNTQAPGTLAVQGSGLTAQNYVFTQAAGNAQALVLKPGSPPVVVSNAAAGIVQDGPLAGSTLSSNNRLGQSTFNADGRGQSGNGSTDGSATPGVAVNTSTQPFGQGTLSVVNEGVRLPPALIN
ncbi:YDG domain-containing protein, partial [Aquabacterium sp. A3]|uniref:beta strand repeat-containing protein n=1 Tax=Aquabacterium sp. A3 TaxID=3132829 RepID=UPI00311A1A39